MQELIKIQKSKGNKDVVSARELQTLDDLQLDMLIDVQKLDNGLETVSASTTFQLLNYKQADIEIVENAVINAGLYYENDRITADVIFICALNSGCKLFCSKSGYKYKPLSVKKFSCEYLAFDFIEREFIPIEFIFIKTSPIFYENGNVGFDSVSHEGKMYFGLGMLNRMAENPFSKQPENIVKSPVTMGELTAIQKTYIMHDSSLGYYKIGKSKEPKVRENTLMAQKPTINILHIIDKNVESELHKRFASKRVRGEWFSLTQDDIKSIVYEFIETSEIQSAKLTPQHNEINRQQQRLR